MDVIINTLGDQATFISLFFLFLLNFLFWNNFKSSLKLTRQYKELPSLCHPNFLVISILHICLNLFSLTYTPIHTTHTLMRAIVFEPFSNKLHQFIFLTNEDILHNESKTIKIREFALTQYCILIHIPNWNFSDVWIMSFLCSRSNPEKCAC